MADTEINPRYITKPIQLLSAWLAGLAIIDGAFLTAAATITDPGWVTGTLVIAAIVNVPIFLGGLFVLQTKFRPEMQEDTYYSRYLERQTSSDESEIMDIEKQVEEITNKIITDMGEDTGHRKEEVHRILKESEIDKLTKEFAGNRTLSELFMYPNKWDELVKSWKWNSAFQKDIEDLLKAGLVIMPGDKVKNMELSKIGEEVAKNLAKENRLWNQNNPRNLK